MIEQNPETAKYFWGVGDIPHLDMLDAWLGKQEFSFSLCPIRFSIGAIFFKREIWEKMGYFKVKRGTNMGQDEIQICSLAMTVSRAIIVSENTVVGHLSFGKHNEAMKEYFLSHPERFQITDSNDASI
jgi:hypothetical protein